MTRYAYSGFVLLRPEKFAAFQAILYVAFEKSLASVVSCLARVVVVVVVASRMKTHTEYRIIVVRYYNATARGTRTLGKHWTLHLRGQHELQN